MDSQKKQKLADALQILRDLGLPSAQQNERSCLCLLALLDLVPKKQWRDAVAPLMGITPIMDWARKHYDKDYAPNTRETVRRQSMHQFVQAGVALYNPDLPNRPVNSPAAVYQISPEGLAIARSFGMKDYTAKVKQFATTKGKLVERNAKKREMAKVPLTIAGKSILLSPGAHSQLILDICQEFGPRYVPGGAIVYVGDTGEKWGHFDEAVLTALGVKVDNHGKMPDVVLYYPEKKWPILAEAVTSHGPVDSQRHENLSKMFKNATAGLVFVSAFPDRKTFSKYQETISWETDVWIADNPSHLIHFNGSRFLGPYPHNS